MSDRKGCIGGVVLAGAAGQMLSGSRRVQSDPRIIAPVGLTVLAALRLSTFIGVTLVEISLPL